MGVHQRGNLIKKHILILLDKQMLLACRLCETGCRFVTVTVLVGMCMAIMNLRYTMACS
ncbi:MAG: hypothetical protein M2R45_02832 [Verrucomicrobia subdivision 3 bacterium]|nr:hypothetical protein [Limisphaerales bacterium]MCS1415465.1 hypothetical protein [Limisphaerales bacterium]